MHAGGSGPLSGSSTMAMSTKKTRKKQAPEMAHKDMIKLMSDERKTFSEEQKAIY